MRQVGYTLQKGWPRPRPFQSAICEKVYVVHLTSYYDYTGYLMWNKFLQQNFHNFCIFQALHNKVKSMLSTKESYSKQNLGQQEALNFEEERAQPSCIIRRRQGGADMPSPGRYSFFVLNEYFFELNTGKNPVLNNIFELNFFGNSKMNIFELNISDK